MKAVNLLPVGRTRVTTRSGLGPIPAKALGPILGVVVLSATAALALAVWSMNSTVANKQGELNALQAHIATLPAPTPAPAVTSGAAEPRRSDVLALADTRLPWDDFLSTFSRVVPENVWLTSLVASSPGAALTVAADQAAAEAALTPPSSASDSSSTTTSTPTPPPLTPSTPSTMTMTGFTYSQPSVARLMRRLALIPWLTNVDLVSSNKTLIDKAVVYQFTVGADVLQQPGSQS